MNAIDTKAAKLAAAHAFMLEDDDLIDDGGEARRHLAAGRPIYFADASTPCGHVVRESPDGLKELVKVEGDGAFKVVGPV